MNYGKVMTKEEFTKAILLRQRKRRIAEEKKRNGKLISIDVVTSGEGEKHGKAP